MNEKFKTWPCANIWRVLICNGAALGIVMGLLEVCWTYLLPVIFPARRYELPVSTIGWFILAAIILDVFLVMAGASVLGLLILIVRNLCGIGRLFNRWPALICFILLTGTLSYLYRGYLYIYFIFEKTVTRFQVLIGGIVVIIIISAVTVLLLEVARQRLWRYWHVAFGVGTVIVLLCFILINYSIYWSQNVVAMKLPVLKGQHRPNVLLVTLDTLRADHLACYGNKIVQTPCLDSIAQDGCLFEAAFAQSPSTTPSHCSIMTSTYQAYHGAFNGVAMRRGITTLAEILYANGYDTAAFVSAAPLRSSNSGLHHGFDYYEDSFSPYSSLFRHDEFQFLLTIHILSHMQLHQIDGFFVSDRAIRWLDKQRKRPFFCWLHYYDPHTPYDAPEPYKNMYAQQINPELPEVLERIHYAGEVTYTDAQLGRVIKALKQKKLYDDTLIIVTADHGEAFGEQHGGITEYGHGSNLYDTTQQVPLIIKLPGAKRLGRRIKDVVQLVDLAPTLLDYLEGPQPESFQGRSLVDLLNGEQWKIDGVAFAECLVTDWSLGQVNAEKNRNRWLTSMRTREIKYICDTVRKRQEFYEIASDQAEAVNIYPQRVELAKSYYKRIQEVIGQPVETGVIGLDPEVLKQLRTLGYVGDNEDGEE